MGNYHRIILVLCLLWSADAAAAPLCDRAVSTSMKDPPIERRVKFSTSPVADTTLFISVAVDPVKPVSIASANLGKTKLTQVETKDKAKTTGIRLFTVPDDGSGVVDVLITYDDAPVADAITIVACSGMDTANPISAVDITPTEKTQETVTLTGNDAAVEQLTITDDDTGHKTIIQTSKLRAATKREW